MSAKNSTFRANPSYLPKKRHNLYNSEFCFGQNQKYSAVYTKSQTITKIDIIKKIPAITGGREIRIPSDYRHYVADLLTYGIMIT